MASEDRSWIDNALAAWKFAEPCGHILSLLIDAGPRPYRDSELDIT
jgi:hypothetical protein